jgi:hypothetical protein
MEIANAEVLAVETAKKPQAGNQQNDVKEEERVGDKGIDAENGEDESIVAREGANVIVDARLDFGEVGGLGEAFEVEELADGPHVGKPAGEGGVGDAGEAVADVQA